MLFKTHEAFGLFAVSLTLVNYTHTPILSVPGILALGVSMVTSIMPDADNPNTVPAKAMMPLAWFLELIHAKHRGITHSFLASAIWLWTIMATQHWRATVGPFHFSMYPIAVGAAVGYWSHLLIDILNKEGEQFLWPFKGRFALFLVSSDGFINGALEYVFAIGTFFVVLYSIGIGNPAVGQVFHTLHQTFPLIPNL